MDDNNRKELPEEDYQSATETRLPECNRNIANKILPTTVNVPDQSFNNNRKEYTKQMETGHIVIIMVNSKLHS